MLRHLASSHNRLVAGLVLLNTGLFIASLSVGKSGLSVWALLWQQDQLDIETLTILTDIRLPRALIAVVAGASLALSGAAMQSLLRNPLASPDLVGAASGASLGAVLVMYYALAATASLLVPIAGFVGALLTSVLVYALAGKDARILTIILAGMAVNSLCVALTALLLNLAPSPYAAFEIMLWLLGDLSNRSLDDFYLMLPVTLIGWALLIGCGRPLDALALGEPVAESMGIRITYLRWRIFIASACAVGAAVATIGNVGFIGLVIPHLLRPKVAYQASRLLWVSALGGSALLLAADVAVRLLPAGVSLQVGVITSLLGAPFFLYLIAKTRHSSL